jgi:methyl-accepting chemotaxis protein
MAEGHSGRLVGTVAAATQINDAMVRDIAQRTATSASTYIDGNLEASSAIDGGRLDRQPAAPGERTSAGGWITSFRSLHDVSGRSVAVLSVAVPDSAFSVIRSSMRTTSGVALGLALLAAFLATVLFAHQVTRPLRVLSHAVEALTGGEMRQQIPVSGHDEVAVVAHAFNSISERIADTIDELAGQIQRLSRGLADLSLVGETLAQSPATP